MQERKNAAKPDKPEVARKAEEKGDLARTRKELSWLPDTISGDSHDRQNAGLYNKLGIVQLQLNNGRGAQELRPGAEARSRSSSPRSTTWARLP